MSPTAKIGIIGGTGVYQLPGVEHVERVEVDTEYGHVVVNVGQLAGKSVAFLTRHGEHHSISPSQINYRANIMALKQLGVQKIYATACSGSANPAYGAGSFVLIDQFVEFTKNRKASFFDNDGSIDRKIAHVDLTQPYCKNLQENAKVAAKELGIDLKEGATYACMEGPRFESRAEIKMLQAVGADILAHTQYPEVALAREAEICYCAIAVVANMAAGIEDAHVSSTELTTNMSQLFGTIQSLLAKCIEHLPGDEDCWCQHALEEAYL